MQTVQAVLPSPAALDEGDALGVDVLGAGKEIAPDSRGGGEVRQSAAEGLDREPAVVLHLLEGLERCIPVDLTGPWRAAIVLADMHVGEDRRDRADGGCRVLFLDVGMKAVIHR